MEAKKAVPNSPGPQARSAAGILQAGARLLDAYTVKQSFRPVRLMIFSAIASTHGESMSVDRIVRFSEGYFPDADAPTRKEITAQLNHLVQIQAIRRSDAGYEIA